MKKSILTAIVFMLCSLSIMAQNRTTGTPKRQTNQGAKTSTPAPAATKKTVQQPKVQQNKKSGKSDGVADAKQRAKTHRQKPDEQQSGAGDTARSQRNNTKRR